MEDKLLSDTVDTITNTGIRRDEYGDYCCAMGVWYGYCHDRFLIELENGTQFTKYHIYQLPDGDKYHGIRFESMEQLKRDGVQLNLEDYQLVYEDTVDDFKGNDTLESLFTKFNIDHPEDFRGHSLSVSDVIVISVDGKDTAYFCDSYGFEEMPEFFKNKDLSQEKEETPLEKAKNLINDFCVGEYNDEADFSDLHNIGLAYTTLTDDELPVQVTADLVDFKITYEFDGEIYNTEQYDNIEDMVDNGLTGLDFSDLVSVPDEVIDRHSAKEEQPVTLILQNNHDNQRLRFSALFQHDQYKNHM